MIKIRLVLILITFILIQPLILKAEEVSLALDEAVALALRNNRDVLLKTEDVKKAKSKIAEARASLFPTLNFTGGWTDTRGLYLKDISSVTTQATLKQYLYKGGKTVNTIAKVKDEFEISQALLDKTRLDVILNVQKAFYTLLLANGFADLNKGILDNTKEHLEVIEARYKNGQASESDVLQISASLSNVKEAYETSLSQVESSRELLRNLLYLDKDVGIKPDAQFTYEPVEVAYDEAFIKAMQTRPEIRQYETQEEADKKAIEIAKADNRPSIYASWDYYSRSHASATTNKGWNDYNIIGLTFSWPIFDGWLTKAKVEQAIVGLKQTQLLKEKTVKDITLELNDAYLFLKNAIAKIKAAESGFRLYSDNLSSAKQKYSRGIISALDMSNANLKYDISVFNKNEAVYDYFVAKSSFDKATGGL